MRALITTDTVGGVWSFTQELTAQLLARGWAIHLVSLGAPPSADQLQWCAHMCGGGRGFFRYDALDEPLEWMPHNEHAWRFAAPRLMRMAEDFKAEIVHANQFCFGALPLEIPIVVTAHSDVLSWARSCGKTLDDTPWLRAYASLVRCGIEGASAVVAPTQWMAASLKQDFRVAAPVEVIPNGRSLAHEPEQPRRLQAVTAGRLWDEAKNVALLTQVESPVPLLVAGATAIDGQSSLPITSGVTMLGPLAPARLHALFRESAMYICPSRYEPFGLAPLEAAQCGCALLLNDIPSLREVWRDDAFFFGNASELQLLVCRLIKCPSELAEAQARAARRACQFTAERMTDGYVALFDRLIARRKEEASLWPAVCA